MSALVTDLRKQLERARFWAKVNIGAPNECWLWTASRNGRAGYGNAVVGRRCVGAHRVAWSLTNGPIPDGLVVMHSCDNPPCCNPAHLSVGTNGDNIRDAAAKGRLSKPSPNLRKLSTDAVIAIQTRVRNGERQKDLAAEYGVSVCWVWRLVNGKRRQHDAPVAPAAISGEAVAS